MKATSTSSSTRAKNGARKAGIAARPKAEKRPTRTAGGSRQRPTSARKPKESGATMNEALGKALAQAVGAISRGGPLLRAETLEEAKRRRALVAASRVVPLIAMCEGSVNQGLEAQGGRVGVDFESGDKPIRVYLRPSLLLPALRDAAEEVASDAVATLGAYVKPAGTA